MNLIDLMRTEVFDAPGGIILPYRIYVPENYDSAKQYPLVLFLHGMGERGDDNRLHISKNSVMETLLLEENLAAYPCVALAPQCPGDSFWGEELLPALMALLEHTRAAYSIDPARIYITGLSMGGFGTWNMLGEYPDYFAAAVPVCGGGDTDSVVRFSHVPVWAFHGTLDTVVFPSGSRDMVTALVRAGARDVHYTEYPDLTHNSWDRAYREPGLFPWLFAQVKA